MHNVIYCCKYKMRVVYFSYYDTHKTYLSVLHKRTETRETLHGGDKMGAHRAQVWAKTNGICWYCGASMNPFTDFNEEHQDPKKQGGGDELENLVPACTRCNSRKWARTVEEYREYLAGKGELRFWGELPQKVDKHEEDARMSLDEYHQVVRSCLYLGSVGRDNLDVILLALTQMSTYWSIDCGYHSENCWEGSGYFSLARLSFALGIPKSQLFFPIMRLNELGILFSSPRRREDQIAFYLHTEPLHNAAITISESRHHERSKSIIVSQ